MKKWIALLLAVSWLASLSACAGRYKLLNVPEELRLDTAALSENMDDMMSITDSTPLIAALPDEGLYVYETDPTIVGGVLFKYDGIIQYFPWSFTPQIAEPEVFLSDYNGDGQTDIAFTYCDTASEIKHNETLHVLLRGEDGFTDCVYTWKSAAVDAKMGVVIDDNGDGTFTAHLNGRPDEDRTLDAAGLGTYMGLYSDDVQDFTLDETITLTVRLGMVFSDTSLPVYDVFDFASEMQLVDGVLAPVNPMIV